MATATAMPPIPASNGNANLRRSRSSPRSNSRRASSPTTKKKNVMSPLLTHSRRSSEMPCPPSSIESRVSHSDRYEEASTLTHASAATVAARRTAAPPVSVRRNTRSGVCMLRAHAVRPENPETSLIAAASDIRPRSWQEASPSQRPVGRVYGRSVVDVLGACVFTSDPGVPRPRVQPRRAAPPRAPRPPEPSDRSRDRSTRPRRWPARASVRGSWTLR